MIHPEYRVLRDNQGAAMSDSLTPIYPATEGVQQGRLRNLTDQALQMMARTPPPELLPTSVREQYGMPSLAAAIQYLHRPPPDADIDKMLAGTHPCQQRLAFEELLAHYLSLRNLRAIAEEIVRGEFLSRVRIGLDFFDASIHRVAAWVIGTRAMLRALLVADGIEPVDCLHCRVANHGARIRQQAAQKVDRLRSRRRTAGHHL